jgi:hypothetical protein
VLIDGGPSDTIAQIVPALEQRIKALPGRDSRVELLAITHVDADHIQGVVSLLSDHRRVKLFRDIWFNGWDQIRPDVLGGVDGERLTAALKSQPERWNRAFQGKAVVTEPDADLPVVTLRDGLRLTVLTPSRAALDRLAPEWEAACRRAGIEPGQGAPIIRKGWLREELLGFDPDMLATAKFSPDRSPPNGSSITAIAEFGGKRVLLLGDATASEVIAGLRRLGDSPFDFDAVKLSHHGSRRNTSLELCQMIRSKKWLVSTNGAVFGHPDPECLARVIVTQNKPTFYLNYVTDRVTDLIRDAGDRYRVGLPRKVKGEFTQGIVVTI